VAEHSSRWNLAITNPHWCAIVGAPFGDLEFDIGSVRRLRTSAISYSC
jgi:hypothetical protein